VKPDEIEGVGGVVDVFNGRFASEAVFLVIQGNIDLVIYLLLPVLGGGVECQDREKQGNEFSQKEAV
jgi:hypothetical protein